MNIFLVAYIANICLQTYLRLREDRVEVLTWKRGES